MFRHQLNFQVMKQTMMIEQICFVVVFSVCSKREIELGIAYNRINHSIILSHLQLQLIFGYGYPSADLQSATGIGTTSGIPEGVQFPNPPVQPQYQYGQPLQQQQQQQLPLNFQPSQQPYYLMPPQGMQMAQSQTNSQQGQPMPPAGFISSLPIFGNLITNLLSPFANLFGFGRSGMRQQCMIQTLIVLLFYSLVYNVYKYLQKKFCCNLLFKSLKIRCDCLRC